MVATTTAGLRGAEWRSERLPPGVQMSAHPLRAKDGASVTGYLFVAAASEPSSAACIHANFWCRIIWCPRSCWVAVLFGCKVRGRRGMTFASSTRRPSSISPPVRHFCETSRSLNSASCRGHPVAARLQRSIASKSARLPKERIKLSPGGRPTGLDSAELREPDGVILVSAHLGQGQIMLTSIDPAVVDETDPLQSDESISLFNPANGFKAPPSSSSILAGFARRYRVAQRDRVGRIDAAAGGCLSERLTPAGAGRSQGTVATRSSRLILRFSRFGARTPIRGFLIFHSTLRIALTAPCGGLIRSPLTTAALVLRVSAHRKAGSRIGPGCLLTLLCKPVRRTSANPR